MKKILLIAMPWQKVSSPSVALGTLKSILNNAGISCDCAYFNINLCQKIGHDIYLKVSEFSDGRFLDGERLFSPFVFSKNEANPRPRKRYWLYALPDETKNKLLSQKEFEDAHQVIPGFLEECMNEIRWDDYDIIGFSTVLEQNLSSLALARRIKEKDPSKIIIFGGANCDGEMGYALHKNFKWIDYTVVGEADNNIVPLIQAIRERGNISGIPGITYRDSTGNIKFTGFNQPVTDLDSIPIPDYDDYFKKMESALPDMPICNFFEASRGCWWGQKHPCTFCGLNRMGHNFRSKSPRRVLKEIVKLSARYKTVDFRAIDNILPYQYMNDMNDLFPLMKRLQKRYNFTISFEVKANLKKEQIKLLKEAGIKRMQPGIESLNDHILQLIGKGAPGIKQIQTLKWMMEFDIYIHYNILFGFPGEAVEDFEDMCNTISFITHIVPPNYCTLFQLQRFSSYFNNPEKYGIKNIRPFISYGGIYPFDQETVFNLAYMFDFDCDRPEEHRLEEARQACIKKVEQWKKTWEPGLLIYKKGPGFSVIHDRREGKNIVHTLNKHEDQVYSFCDSVRTVEQIVDKFTGKISKEDVSNMLESFLKNKIIYKDSNRRFLSLALAKK
jgi:ribosomal peptide maturation radical SAM protein 1